MLDYLPWSSKALTRMLKIHDSGGIGSIDLELTAQCTHASCLYCDSKPGVGKRDPNELTLDETITFLNQAIHLKMEWVYSCGLGEPLEDRKFDGLVEWLSAHNTRLSIFTNGLLIDKHKAQWLKDHGVCLILKLDTFDEFKFDQILDRPGAAKRIYQALEYLLEAGYGEEETGYTNLAFSIVPTRLSIDGVTDVVRFALKHNIFPSIGELEQAGMVGEDNAFAKLALTRKETEVLKAAVVEIVGQDYMRPICPAILAGLHVTNIGKCVVEKDTGLNCKWFLMEEPSVQILGDVRTDNISDLAETIRTYRNNAFADTAILSEYASMDCLFGGCGGNPRNVIALARKHLNRASSRLTGNGSLIQTHRS